MEQHFQPRISFGVHPPLSVVIDVDDQYTDTPVRDYLLAHARDRTQVSGQLKGILRLWGNPFYLLRLNEEDFPSARAVYAVVWDNPASPFDAGAQEPPEGTHTVVIDGKALGIYSKWCESEDEAYQALGAIVKI